LWCSGVNVKQPRFRDVQGIKQIVVLNSGDNDDDEDDIEDARIEAEARQQRHYRSSSGA
jgi:hypothetical protein